MGLNDTGNSRRACSPWGAEGGGIHFTIRLPSGNGLTVEWSE